MQVVLEICIIPGMSSISKNEQYLDIGHSVCVFNYVLGNVLVDCI